MSEQPSTTASMSSSSAQTQNNNTSMASREEATAPAPLPEQPLQQQRNGISKSKFTVTPVGPPAPASTKSNMNSQQSQPQQKIATGTQQTNNNGGPSSTAAAPLVPQSTRPPQTQQQQQQAAVTPHNRIPKSSSTATRTAPQQLSSSQTGPDSRMAPQRSFSSNSGPPTTASTTQDARASLQRSSSTSTNISATTAPGPSRTPQPHSASSSKPPGSIPRTASALQAQTTSNPHRAGISSSSDTNAMMKQPTAAAVTTGTNHGTVPPQRTSSSSTANTINSASPGTTYVSSAQNNRAPPQQQSGSASSAQHHLNSASSGQSAANAEQIASNGSRQAHQPPVAGNTTGGQKQRSLSSSPTQLQDRKENLSDSQHQQSSVSLGHQTSRGLAKQAGQLPPLAPAVNVRTQSTSAVPTKQQQGSSERPQLISPQKSAPITSSASAQPQLESHGTTGEVVQLSSGHPPQQPQLISSSDSMMVVPSSSAAATAQQPISSAPAPNTIVGMVGSTPIVRMSQGTTFVKKKKGRFHLLQEVPIVGSGEVTAVTAPDGTTATAALVSTASIVTTTATATTTTNGAASETTVDTSMSSVATGDPSHTTMDGATAVVPQSSSVTPVHANTATATNAFGRGGESPSEPNNAEHSTAINTPTNPTTQIGQSPAPDTNNQNKDFNNNGNHPHQQTRNGKEQSNNRTQSHPNQQSKNDNDRNSNHTQPHRSGPTDQNNNGSTTTEFSRPPQKTSKQSSSSATEPIQYSNESQARQQDTKTVPVTTGRPTDDPAATRGVQPNRSPPQARAGESTTSFGSMTTAASSAPAVRKKGRFVITSVTDPSLLSQTAQMVPITLAATPTVIATIPTTATAEPASSQHADGDPHSVNVEKTAATTTTTAGLMYAPTQTVMMTNGTTATLVPQQVLYTTTTTTASEPNQSPVQQSSDNHSAHIQTGHNKETAMMAGENKQYAQGNRQLSNASSEQSHRMQENNRQSTDQHQQQNRYKAKPTLASQKGLGKVFYFLDQMRSEVLDADRTIKTLQSDMKSLQTDMKYLKEKNKELEGKARDAERKLNEERSLRETAERKLRDLKRVIRENGWDPVTINKTTPKQQNNNGTKNPHDNNRNATQRSSIAEGTPAADNPSMNIRNAITETTTGTTSTVVSEHMNSSQTLGDFSLTEPVSSGEFDLPANTIKGNSVDPQPTIQTETATENKTPANTSNNWQQEETMNRRPSGDSLVFSKNDDSPNNSSHVEKQQHIKPPTFDTAHSSGQTDGTQSSKSWELNGGSSDMMSGNSDTAQLQPSKSSAVSRGTSGKDINNWDASQKITISSNGSPVTVSPVRDSNTGERPSTLSNGSKMAEFHQATSASSNFDSHHSNGQQFNYHGTSVMNTNNNSIGRNSQFGSDDSVVTHPAVPQQVPLKATAPSSEFDPLLRSESTQQNVSYQPLSDGTQFLQSSYHQPSTFGHTVSEQQMYQQTQLPVLMMDQQTMAYPIVSWANVEGMGIPTQQIMQMPMQQQQNENGSSAAATGYQDIASGMFFVQQTDISQNSMMAFQQPVFQLQSDLTAQQGHTAPFQPSLQFSQPTWQAAHQQQRPQEHDMNFSQTTPPAQQQHQAHTQGQQNPPQNQDVNFSQPVPTLQQPHAQSQHQQQEMNFIHQVSQQTYVQSQQQQNQHEATFHQPIPSAQQQQTQMPQQHQVQDGKSFSQQMPPSQPRQTQQQQSIPMHLRGKSVNDFDPLQQPSSTTSTDTVMSGSGHVHPSTASNNAPQQASANGPGGSVDPFDDIIGRRGSNHEHQKT